MNTRSQTRYNNSAIYKVDIDFDEASALWRSNKKSIGNGSYKYVCGCKTKSGNSCKRERLHDSNYCKIHKNTKI